MSNLDEVVMHLMDIKSKQAEISGKVESQGETIKRIEETCNVNRKTLQGNGSGRGLVTRVELLESDADNDKFWKRKIGGVVVTIIVTALVGLILVAG